MFDAFDAVGVVVVEAANDGVEVKDCLRDEERDEDAVLFLPPETGADDEAVTVEDVSMDVSR